MQISRLPWTRILRAATLARRHRETLRREIPMKLTLPVAALVLYALVASRPVAAAPGDATRIMTSLDNPRGLTFAPNGALFVAESGHGGPLCVPGGGISCYGSTGAVTRYWHGEQVRVATGLPSLATAGGAQARGPNEIALHGSGRAILTVGLEATASGRNTLGRDGL